MTIDRINRALKDAVEDAWQCLLELDAKVQDLEIENQKLNEDLDVANDEVSALQGQVNDIEDRLRHWPA